MEARSSSGAHGRQLESGVHGGLMLWQTQGGGQYSPRWSLLWLCQILYTSWVTCRLGVVLGVDSLRVGFESDSSSLGLPYNKGGTTRCNLWRLDSNRHAGGAGGLCRRLGWSGVAVSWGGAPVVMPRRCRRWTPNCVTKSRCRSSCCDCLVPQ
jgi:hypothetical protein